MSALGQKRTSECFQPMSALPPKADIGTQSRNVRFVPEADMGTAYSITSSALESNFSCLFARRVAAGESGADDSDSSAASAYKLRRRAPARPIAEGARGRSATIHHRYCYRSRCHPEPGSGRGRVAKLAKFGSASALPPLY